MLKSDKQFYINGLKSNECICGRSKKRGHAFCWICYKSLPKYLQTGLYKPFGPVYTDAYEESVKQLHIR